MQEKVNGCTLALHRHIHQHHSKQNESLATLVEPSQVGMQSEVSPTVVNLLDLCESPYGPALARLFE